MQTYSLPNHRRCMCPPPPPPPPTIPINSQWNNFSFDLQNSDSDSDIDFWWDPPASLPPPFLILSGEDLPEANGNTSDSLLASCPICQDNLHAPDTTVQHLPCTHVYHRHCIMLWLQDKNTCPVCRFQILSDDLDLLLSSSLARPAQSMQQHLPAQSFSSTILHELPPLPPRPPLSPPGLHPILLRPPAFWHQSATTPSPLITPHTEAETVIQPSAPVLSTTTEESLPSPQTQLPPDSLAISTIREDEIHSVSQRGSNRRIRKGPICWFLSRCIGRF